MSAPEAKFWAQDFGVCPPKSANTRHKHVLAEEFYFVLEGVGRMRVGEVICTERLAFLYTDPWFIATLFDAYWGFITFYLWQAWKEPGVVARLLWLIAVILLGNIAMAIYVLTELMRIQRSSQLSEVITRRNTGQIPLPATLAAGAIVIYLLA